MFCEGYAPSIILCQADPCSRMVRQQSGISRSASQIAHLLSFVRRSCILYMFHKEDPLYFTYTLKGAYSLAQDAHHILTLRGVETRGINVAPTFKVLSTSLVCPYPRSPNFLFEMLLSLRS